MKPEEVGDVQRSVLPAAVFDAFNAEIAGSFGSGSARVMQNKVANRIAAAMGIERQEVYDKHYLDVEEAYRDEGWNVEYEKPAYNESYEAFFVFKRDW